MQQERQKDEQPNFQFPDANDDQHETEEAEEFEEEDEGGGMLGPPRTRQRIDSISPSLPQLPLNSGDLDFDVTTIIKAASAAESDVHSDEKMQKVQKRASNVLKLSQENERLKQELQAMADRLEAAERRRKELEKRGETSS